MLLQAMVLGDGEGDGEDDGEADGEGDGEGDREDDGEDDGEGKGEGDELLVGASELNTTVTAVEVVVVDVWTSYLVAKLPDLSDAAWKAALPVLTWAAVLPGRMLMP